MKTLPYPIRNSRCIVQCALATAALFLGACSATAPVKGGTERHGQVKFSSAKEQIVGEIAIRHDKNHFHAEITKGPGVPLLTISAKFGIDSKSKENKELKMISSRISGPLAHGGLTYRPKDLAKKPSPPASYPIRTTRGPRCPRSSCGARARPPVRRSASRCRISPSTRAPTTGM